MSRNVLRVAAAALTLGVTAMSGPNAFAAADPISDGQWYVQALRLDEAHKLSKGKGIVVAVIDTGVDPTHPDIAGSVVAGTDTSRLGPGDGLADESGHGTGMAGLIVGRGRTRGVAPEAHVMAIRAETSGGGSPTAVGSAINWAVDHGATVISISLGSPSGDRVLKAAVEKALTRDVVIVASAGNTDGLQYVGYPAAYGGVVATGGTTRDGGHCPVAVSGPQIAISAPCHEVSSPDLRHQRTVASGTSHSAALVAGSAALVRARFPELSARNVVHRLTATAVDRGTAGRDNQFGFGMLNPVGALTADVAPLPPEPVGATESTLFTTSAPLAAPGAEFPVGLAVTIGLVLLALVAAVVALATIRHRGTDRGVGR